MEERKAFGEQLGMIRHRKGITAYRVAKDGGIQEYHVKAIENGSTNYTVDSLFGYLKGCGVRVEVRE